MYDLVDFENSYGDVEDGNEFICIDGYPADENAEGEVVAKVWKTKHGDIIVDWHDNGYRLNKQVLELIEDSKRQLIGEGSEGEEEKEEDGEEGRDRSPLPTWTVALIDGHDLKYKTHTVSAAGPEEAIDAACDYFGANFDHRIVSVKPKEKEA